MQIADFLETNGLNGETG